jgi:GTPase SAR1 family protein
MEPENEAPPAVEPAASSSLPSKYKIVFLGDTYVGKTCLINRFMYDTFNENYQVISQI